jgi:hypothetical protein
VLRELITNDGSSGEAVMKPTNEKPANDEDENLAGTQLLAK